MIPFLLGVIFFLLYYIYVKEKESFELDVRALEERMEHLEQYPPRRLTKALIQDVLEEANLKARALAKEKAKKKRETE